MTTPINPLFYHIFDTLTDSYIVIIKINEIVLFNREKYFIEDKQMERVRFLLK